MKANKSQYQCSKDLTSITGGIGQSIYLAQELGLSFNYHCDRCETNVPAYEYEKGKNKCFICSGKVYKKARVNKKIKPQKKLIKKD